MMRRRIIGYIYIQWADVAASDTIASNRSLTTDVTEISFLVISLANVTFDAGAVETMNPNPRG